MAKPAPHTRFLTLPSPLISTCTTGGTIRVNNVVPMRRHWRTRELRRNSCVGRSPPKSPMPPLRNSEFHDQRCFARLLAFVGRVGLRAFFRSSAEREMGVCYLIRGSNASSKSK